MLFLNPVSGGPFYAILIYITLFYNLELTTAGGFFKLLSHNVILFLFYTAPFTLLFNHDICDFTDAICLSLNILKRAVTLPSANDFMIL
ncbi:hypothetical protein VEV11M_43770 (plasmid) [Escherichia coli]|nr:hypothetical protein VEV11M_43770 [Escherichia coli]